MFFTKCIWKHCLLSSVIATLLSWWRFSSSNVVMWFPPYTPKLFFELHMLRQQLWIVSFQLDLFLHCTIRHAPQSTLIISPLFFLWQVLKNGAFLKPLFLECWPKKWLPEDLNNNVRILSLSYDSNIVASVHNDVTEIGKNLIQSLVTNARCDNLLYLWPH